jgi:predicted DNA-binding transcriptional regulator AlpA
LPNPIKIGSRNYWIDDEVDETIANAQVAAA